MKENAMWLHDMPDNAKVDSSIACGRKSYKHEVFNNTLKRVEQTAYHIRNLRNKIAGSEEIEACESPNFDFCLGDLLVQGPEVIHKTCEEIDNVLEEIEDLLF